MARGDELIKSRLAESRRSSGADQPADEVAARYVERYFGSMVRDYAQLKEKLELLTGERGDGSQRALTPANPGTTTDGGGTTIVVTNPDPEVSDPTQPQNVTADGAFTHIVVQCDPPLFVGYKETQLWRNTADDFGTATLVDTKSGSIFGDTVGLNAKFYYWLRFINLLGEPGPVSESAYAETSINITAEMERLSDYLNAGLLAQALAARIDLIDAPDTGVIDQLAQEVSDRIAAIQAEIGERQTAIQDEAATRQNNDVAEATTRNLLAAQLRGNYEGTNLSELTSGMLYQERLVRSTQYDALAQQISLLSAGVGGGFDPLETWYFDADVQGWSATGGTLAWVAGWIRLTSTGADPQLSKSGLSITGTQYASLKLRVKRIAGSGWDGDAYYSTAGHGFSGTYKKALADPSLAVGDSAIINWDFSDIADWTASTITGLRVDLGSTSADVFDIDWIAIGREAPGASVASLLAEQTARASADAAEATARGLLSTKLVGVSDPSGIANLAGVTSGLLADEKNARSAADAAEVTARQTLSTKMIGVADPSTIGSLAQVTSGLLAEEKTARSDANTARASEITTINSRLDSPSNGLAANATAIQNTNTTVQQQGAAITAHSQSFTQLQSIVGPNYAAMQAIYDVTVGPQGLNAQVVFKTDVNGYLAGWGLWNTGKTSQAIFSVDDFAVGKAGAGTVYPFIVSGGVVYIKSLMVQDGSLASAKIQNLNVDKLVGATASFVINNIGYATIDFAKITNSVQSNNYQWATQGWRIDKDGWAEFRSIIARGDIEASTLKANTLMVNTANLYDLGVTTLKIAGNAVSVMVGAQGANYPVYVYLTVAPTDIPPGQSTVPIAITMSRHQGQTARFSLGYYKDGSGLNPLFDSQPPLGVWAYTYLFNATPGSYAFVTYDSGGGYPSVYNSSITATLGKR